MNIPETAFKKYDRYEDFTSEFVRSAMENGVAFLIVNWQDALGVCQLLNTFTINGNSIAMRGEFTDEAYADVQCIKEYDGNTLVTLFVNGEIICEKALDDESAYDEAYADVQCVKEYDGNILITLFANGEIICEKALDDESAYVDDGVYFVEYSAKNFTLPLHATVIPFRIEAQIFDQDKEYGRNCGIYAYGEYIRLY